MVLVNKFMLMSRTKTEAKLDLDLSSIISQFDGSELTCWWLICPKGG